MSFNDSDYVYVDPDLKEVVSLVEWDKDGNAVAKEWPRITKDSGEENGKKRPPKKGKKRYYPWGSYKTMKKIYKLEGKVKDGEVDDYIPLETAIDKLQQEPYWD